MKKYFISVLVILFNVLQFTSGQIKDIFIQLTPEIGDTISLSERNYYNLFPIIKDYQYAVFYLINDTTSELRIWYLNEDKSLADTIIINGAEAIGNYKAYIRQIDNERLKNFESDFEIKVTKLDGNQIEGKLLSVQDSSFLMCPNSVSLGSTQNFLKTYIMLKTDKVESVQLEFDSWNRAYSGMRIGILLGCISGVIISVATKSTTSDTETGWGMSEEGSNWLKGFTYTVVGGLIGGALGAGVGLLTSSDERIEINSASDLEKLKEYIVQ